MPLVDVRIPTFGRKTGLAVVLSSLLGQITWGECILASNVGLLAISCAAPISEVQSISRQRLGRYMVANPATNLSKRGEWTWTEAGQLPHCRKSRYRHSSEVQSFLASGEKTLYLTKKLLRTAEGGESANLKHVEQ